MGFPLTSSADQNVRRPSQCLLVGTDPENDYRFTRDEAGDKYIEKRKRKAFRTFIVAFDVACENCSFRDWVKVSNIGWQGGTHAETLRQETI